MRIAQIVLPGASAYEQKSQRADFAALASLHDVRLAAIDSVTAASADIAHVYGPMELPRAPFAGFPIPYVANGTIPPSRLPFRVPRQPARLLSPVPREGWETTPEIVEESYFGARRAERSQDGPRVLGTFRGGREVRRAVEQTLARIHRFRDDVEWNVFDTPPNAADLTLVDTWVDPSLSDDDYDGFCAEAVVSGIPVVASRTAINVQRLEKGRTGWLVPPGDFNELTHAILAALFKPEAASARLAAATQTASKFASRHRLRVLKQVYEALTP